ncbi:MAG: hypothetical protein ACI4SS_07090 [Clostridia bacterium]
MKWSTVKNLILGLLIVMNVFVMSIMLVKRYSSEKIPPLVLAASAEAMESSGISCESGLLPDRYMSLKRLKADFLSAAELSRMFFGGQLAFQTDQRTLIARKDGAELRVEEFGFSYSDGRTAAEATEKELRRALKELGLDMRYAEYDENSGVFLCYYNDMRIFDMYIRASIGEDGTISSIEACWPEIRPAGGTDTGVSVISCLPSIIETFSGGTVKSIETGYTLVKSENTDSYLFSPAWRVTMEDGRSADFTE